MRIARIKGFLVLPRKPSARGLVYRRMVYSLRHILCDGPVVIISRFVERALDQKQAPVRPTPLIMPF